MSAVMCYIKVRWLHPPDEYPVLLYSELGEDRYERRKVEVFGDGRMQHASALARTGDTDLGELPVPPLEEIAKDPQFEPMEIGKEEFEAAWTEARGPRLQASLVLSGTARPLTPTRPISASGRYVRQCSGTAHYGHVELLLEPMPGEENASSFSWDVAEAAVPREYADAVLEGILAALEEDDSPFDTLRGARVRVVGGSCVPVDSQYGDYVMAAREGMRRLLRS